jgi:hypothetical protein
LGSGLGKNIRVCRASGPFSHLCVQMFCISVRMCHLATASESGVIGSHPCVISCVPVFASTSARSLPGVPTCALVQLRVSFR